MPEIEIRPAAAADIPLLMALDHSYSSDFVWQMDIQALDGQISASFREMRLPRSVRVEYPRPVRSFAEEWSQRSAVLVAVHQEQPCGYISLVQETAPATTWARDLVVERRLRRQGIGATLVLAGQEWALRQGQTRQLVLEMQPKNHPAISLALKLGFDFCGYNDRYYANHEIGLFFARSLR